MSDDLKNLIHEYLRQNLRVEVTTECLSSMNNIRVNTFLDGESISSDETFIDPCIRSDDN